MWEAAIRESEDAAVTVTNDISGYGVTCRQRLLESTENGAGLLEHALRSLMALACELRG